jgi:hypothetical protein
LKDSVVIENNEIYNNNSSYAGGIYVAYNGGGGYINQNLIYNNTLSFSNGAGILLSHPHSENTIVSNNTICNNKVDQGYEGDDFYTYAACQLRNNIIFNVSDTNHSIGWYSTVTPDFDFNCFNQKGLSIIGPNNIFSDPSFTNPTLYIGSTTNIGIYDWSLTRFSPCINKGDTILFPFQLPVDIAGFPRIAHNRIDMGAYEYQGPLSVNEMDGIYTYKVFPNPANGIVNFVLNNYNLFEINLYNMFARKILNQKFTGATSIDMKPFSRGIYFYEIIEQSRVIGKGKIVRE